MTTLLKCDECGKTVEAALNGSNPYGWYSRIVNGKVEHACCREHITEGVTLPW